MSTAREEEVADWARRIQVGTAVAHRAPPNSGTATDLRMGLRVLLEQESGHRAPY